MIKYMKEEIIEVKKMERTDKDVDNSGYEFKSSYEEDDGDGGFVVKYKKETINKDLLEKQLQEAEERVNSLRTKLTLIK